MSKLGELLEENKIDYALGGEHKNVREGWIGIDCIRCSPNTGKMLLGFREELCLATCWQCGVMNFHGTLSEITRVSISKIKSIFSNLNHSELIYTKKARGKYTEPEGVGPLLASHLKYLQERLRCPLREVRELERVWSLGGIGAAPALSWRVFLPVLSGGEKVSWTSRSVVSKARVPYWNAKSHEESISSKELLYGEDFCKSKVLCVEGPLDTLVLGFGCVSTLGVKYTRDQLLRLSKYPVRYICYDNQDQAQVIARQLCSDLSMFPGVTTNLRLDSGKDPGEANNKERQELRELLA